MGAFTWTDRSVRQALDLRTEPADEGVRYGGVSTDSRTVTDGDLYVALVGDRFDGHDFVADALAGGARGAVVSRAVPGNPGARLYPVDDTLEALGALAAHRRQALSAPVVAITGSSGKTATKDLTRAVLSSTLRVHATEGNLNNRVGMPLTLLGVPDEAEAVVLELGSNEPGEIAAITAVARPDVGVVTTVAEAHLEKLGSFEGVLDEKLDLLRGLAEGGRCVVSDEPTVLAERARALCPRLTVVGWSARADESMRPDDVVVDHGGAYRFRWRGLPVALRMPGRHAVTNALLALAVADLLDVPAGDAARGVADAPAAGLRGELRRVGGLTVVVDCYNANPQSVRAALGLLEDQGGDARRVAVLGSMLELGEASAGLHMDVLAEVLDRDIDLVVATGHFAAAAVALGADAKEPRLLVSESWKQAYPLLRDRLEGGEVVLLKASRGVAMEGILPLLEADFQAEEVA